jgi:hypothetical protein
VLLRYEGQTTKQPITKEGITMYPNLKKALSAILFAVLGALLVAIQQKLVPLAPEAMQATIVAALAGLAHYLDAWGHQDRVAAQVTAAKASAPPAPPPSSPNWPTAAALFLLCCFGLHASACSLFGSKLPAAEKCLPTPATLLSQVTDILLAGGDYTTALEQKALADGEDAVLCAVKAFLSSGSKLAAGEADLAARKRARAYLATKGVQ